MQNDLIRPIIGIENRTAQEVFDIMCDRFRHLSATVPAGDGGLVEAVMRIRATAMLWTLRAQTPEAGLFGAIAQDADWLCDNLPARLSQGMGVTDEMVERFAAELWKLDDAYARSIPHSKIRIALETALSGDTL